MTGRKGDNMNIIIATLIIAGIPTWQMIQSLERNHIGKAVVNAIQIVTFVLLMRAVM